MNQEELYEAVAILKLPLTNQPPEIEEVKKVHRELIQHWHPDVSKEKNALEMSKKINAAADLLLAYIPEFHKQVALQRQQMAQRVIRINYVFTTANTSTAGSSSAGTPMYF